MKTSYLDDKMKNVIFIGWTKSFTLQLTEIEPMNMNLYTYTAETKKGQLLL